jgi:DNA-directed RNA polymerase sigma subunit (sigma70/sigma32)
MKTLDEFDGSPGWESPSLGARDASQGDTSIALYLRDIGRVKRPTPEEEIELAGRIKKGDREARDQMIKSNEIGQELGLSSERVRQLQNAALKKVRRRINDLENRSLSPTRLRSGNQFKLRL